MHYLISPYIINDLIFITHCCFTSDKSLQMEITADNINMSSDEPQTFFFYMFSVLANMIMKLLLHSVGQVKKRKKKMWKQSYILALDLLILDSVSLH